jgi:hypothetical protein
MGRITFWSLESLLDFLSLLADRRPVPHFYCEVIEDTDRTAWVCHIERTG